MVEHREYDGREIRAEHLGLTGKAWVSHAWDDWYYVHVEGVWANGNEAKGVYCREQAHTIRKYLKDNG